MHKTIILASRSPRRVELLKQIHIDCKSMPADIDETPQLNEQPKDYVMRLAQQKAVAVASILPAELAALPILAADTTVAIGAHILGKPENDADAMQMLQQLSGGTHYVYTAVAVHYLGELQALLSTTTVEMMPLTDTMIANYIASGQHHDKAGSYAIQGLAATWIKRIDGSYSGVMGLPLHETARLLADYVALE